MNSDIFLEVQDLKNLKKSLGLISSLQLQTANTANRERATKGEKQWADCWHMY